MKLPRAGEFEPDPVLAQPVMLGLFVTARLPCRPLFVPAEDAAIADRFGKASVSWTQLTESNHARRAFSP